VFTRDNRRAQDFTSDKSKLRAAVEQFSPGTAFIDPSSYQAEGAEIVINRDSYYYESSVRTLANVADYLVSAANRRKALVYISEGVPMDPVLAGTADCRSIPPRGDHPENCAIHQNLMQDMLDTFRRAQRANVAVYAFDPSPTLFEETLGPFLMGHALQGEAFAIAHHKANLTTDFLEATASNTGGRAVLKAPDAPAGIEQMFIENSSYYLLGYHSANMKTDSYRNVSVKVNRPGIYEVRARNRYYVEKAADPKRATTSPREKAMAGMLPDAGMDLELVTAPFSSPDVEGAAVVLAIGVKQEAPKKQGFQSVDYLVRAFTPEGAPKSGRTQKINVAVHAAEMGADDEYDLLMTLPVKPGRYEIRASVHNATLDREGSVYGDVVVPDFSKDPLSLSGVIVSAKPARVAAPYFATETVSPIVPTTRRVFTHEDRVSTFLRAYQAKVDVFAPVQVAIRIVDDHDNVVSDTTQTLGPDDFSKKTRSADVNYPLPAVNLAPGNYLLTFEATAGTHKARRDVRFSVR
jgi:VWFA-related protein